MTRGMGRLFKRGAVYWIAYYGPNPERPGRKKEFRESADSGDEREAVRLLKRRLGEIHADRFVGPQQERVTIAELLDHYRDHRELAGAKSLTQFRSQVRRVSGFFGTARAIDITTEGLQKWLRARLAEGVAKATAQQWLAILRASMRLALKEGRLARLPYFPGLTIRNARKGFFEAEEFAAVVAHLPATLADIARFGYLTGWRRGEILALTWDQVDRRHGTITLPDSKNGDPRIVPIVGELADVIERRWEARVIASRKPGAEATLSAFVFHRRGRAISSFRKRWGRACIKAGFYKPEVIDGVTVKVPTKLFHDLRRTSVRDMVRGGTKETVAMAISGHRTRHVFDRYNISSLDDQQAALLRTEAYRAARPVKVADISRTPKAAQG